MMTHRPDWAQVLGTAVVLVMLAAVAFVDFASVEADVLYRQNGDETDIDAAIRGSTLHSAAAFYLQAVAFPTTATAGRWPNDGFGLFVVALALNVALNVSASAYLIRWAGHAALARVRRDRRAV